MKHQFILWIREFVISRLSNRADKPDVHSLLLQIIFSGSCVGSPVSSQHLRRRPDGRIRACREQRASRENNHGIIIRANGCPIHTFALYTEIRFFSICK